MKTRVSEKGQVTIPKMLRDRLGIHMGDELDFVEENGRLVVEKVGEKDPVDALYGLLKVGGDTDAMMVEMRGPRTP